jgi:hypothetical protein
MRSKAILYLYFFEGGTIKEHKNNKLKSFSLTYP